MALPDFDPATRPDLYRMVNHRDGTTSFLLRKRLRVDKHLVHPADPALLGQLVKRCPLPVMFLPSPARHARQAGNAYYWSEAGCHKHGKPMLRYSSGGSCVACDMEINEARREVRAMSKRNARIPLDQLPRNRSEAAMLGMKTYFDGTECMYGHVAERRTSNKRCMKCENPSYELPPALSPGRKPDDPLPDYPPLETHFEYPGVEHKPRPRNPPKPVSINTPEDDQFMSELDKLLKR